MSVGVCIINSMVIAQSKMDCQFMECFSRGEIELYVQCIFNLRDCVHNRIYDNVGNEENSWSEQIVVIYCVVLGFYIILGMAAYSYRGFV